MKPKTNNNPTGEQQHSTSGESISDAVSKQIDTLFQDGNFIRKISQLLVESLIEPIKRAISDSIAESVKDSVKHDLQNMTDRLDELQNKYNDIEDILDEQEQYSRRNCLVVHGVSENDRENTNEVIMGIIKNNLNIDVRPGDLDRSHRLGAKGRGERPRGIIVKFTNYSIRDLVYKAKRRLKGTTPKMYILESLTAKRAKLLSDLRKTHVDKLTASWTQDGRVHLLTKSNQRRTITKLSEAKKLRL